MNDDLYIEKTLELAARGRGEVSPNPLVGCVIVKDGEIIGEGYHKKFGDKHAEVNAIENCKRDPAGATLYVNLEPCSHFGKTPPCTALIIEKKIARVVIGMQDPNKLVNGRGISILRDAGIETSLSGKLTECLELNRFFLKNITEAKPYITLKAAQTIDGKIAGSDGGSKWLSSVKSRLLVHKLRAEYDAVMVGSGTVKTDDPLLNVRDAEGRDPHIVLVDRDLSILPESRLFNPALRRKIFIITSEKFREKSQYTERYSGSDTEIIFVPEIENPSGGISGHLDLDSAFSRLSAAGIASVLVEGGAGIFSSLISNNLFDELMVFISPKLLGSGKDIFSSAKRLSVEDAVKLKLYKTEQIEDDILAIYRKQ